MVASENTNYFGRAQTVISYECSDANRRLASCLYHQTSWWLQCCRGTYPTLEAAQLLSARDSHLCHPPETPAQLIGLLRVAARHEQSP